MYINIYTSRKMVARVRGNRSDSQLPKAKKKLAHSVLKYIHNTNVYR